jgi:hypothetical protein
MAEHESAAPPRREVSWGGRFFGLGIMGTVVIVVIAGENSGNAAITANAAPILGAALAAAIGLPLALFRRTVRE